MRNLNLACLKIILISLCLFWCNFSSAQNNYNNIIFKIDSLADVGLPKSALSEVGKLEAVARKENNPSQIIRAVIYHLKFQTYLEDDALVSVIKTLRSDIDKSSYPVKPILQSFLAGMYWNYYQENRERFAGRSKLEKADVDFRNWDLATIIEQTTKLYQLSLSEAEKEQDTKIDLLNGMLEGDLNTRNLRPALYDLLLHRALDYFLDEEPALTKPKMPFTVNDARFFGESKAFANLIVKTSDTSSTLYQGIKYLQQGIAYHLKSKNKGALADLELKRLSFLYSKASIKDKDSLYISDLRVIAGDTSAGVIRADALVTIGKYYIDADSLATALFYLKKAVAGYSKSLGAKNAANLIKTITQKALSATMEDINVPKKPLLAQLSYRNITSANYKIYFLTDAQVSRIKKMTSNMGQILPNKGTFAYLKSLNPVQYRQLRLPRNSDYKEHSTEFKIHPLRDGTYLLLLKQATQKDSLIQLTSFKVSNLAYTLRTRPGGMREIRVVNRETGILLKGVSVVLTHQPDGYGKADKKPIIVSGITDENGAFIFSKPGNNFSVSLSYNDDHLLSGEQYDYYSSSPWSDNQPFTRTIFFTDRQIYRPGQTIYFKALQIQSNNGKSQILPKTDLSIEFKGQNGLKLGSAKLQTNEFGTIASSFIIPQNILNGTVNISTSTGSIGVRVEEYKRPTFQVGFEPFTKSSKLNDSITVKGSVKAFSGYGLSDVRVACRITRAPNLRVGNFESESIKSNKRVIAQGNSSVTEILTDTIKTDEQGRFELKFLAAGVNKDGSSEAYTFAISADATDGSNETQSATTEIQLSNKTIQLEANIPETVTTTLGINTTVQIYNSKYKRQNGSATIRIYALKGPGVFYKERLWEAPDKLMISKTDFKKDFPSFSYDHEDEYKNWQRGEKISDLQLDLNKTDESAIDLSKVLKSPPGVYEVVISVKSEDGDTTSLVRYINFVDEYAPVQKSGDWILPVATSVNPHEPAEFFIGLNKNCSILFETYDGPKLLSSKIFALYQGSPQKIVVPVPPTLRNSFSVQFTAINENRLYNYYHRITVKDTIKPLNISFITFRDKLQPGQKEQWKLRITGNNNQQTSELLAGLYDASLDDIAPAASWQKEFTYLPYQGSYFQWERIDLSSSINTIEDESYTQYFSDYIETRTYESVNMLGFYYYGNDNRNYSGFLEDAKEFRTIRINEKKNEARYKKNATLVKNGFDVIGRVVYPGTNVSISGIKVKINNSNISTVTNSLGYFKIRIPVNSVLVFSGKYWITQKIAPQKGQRLIVRMLSPVRELGVQDPGVKSIKGDPNSAIRIDEPVGNSDIKMVAEEDNKSTMSYGYNGYTTSKVKFPPPVVKADDEVKEYDKVGTRDARIGNKASPVTIRKNFNETAFFYPQLHTDDKGEILIDFTIPESLTRWKFRGFAHNKDLQSGYIEQEVITRKHFMISANMPRFLREGDTLTVSARVVNLTDTGLKGHASLELFNAVTMQPVNLFSKAGDAEQRFELGKSSTNAVTFKLIVPAGIDALTYRLTASAGNYTDGEENTLPVLPNSIPVTETMPMMVRAGQTKEFTFDKLVNQTSPTLKSRSLTLEYTQSPIWTVVQSLPYVMEYPYECSEQIFSRYYANSYATSIVNNFPKIKQAFAQWKNADSKALLSNLEKDPELKSVLLEETPWLGDAISEEEQKKRIALLFDLNKMSDELDQNLSKLQKKQLPDGGFPWFAGHDADQYITQHILAGIGQINTMDIANKNNILLTQISSNALGYLDKQLKYAETIEKKQDKHYQTRELSALEIHAWYARSYFSAPMDDELITVRKTYLNRALSQWVNRSEFEKAMIGITLSRWRNFETTSSIIRSLVETAHRSDDLGMYWTNNQPGYYWYQSPIETQSLMIELFTEAANKPEELNEMRIWLLHNKQTNSWGTTKATTAACYALLIKGGYALSDTSKTTIWINNKPLEQLKPELKEEAGTHNIKTAWLDEQIKPSLGRVKITNNNKSVSWGAMFWQYTERPDKITASNTNVEIERKYYIQKQTDSGPELIAVNSTHLPKTGDILKVIIHLKADRDLDYIQLKDMRPSGAEPVDALSEFKYQDGLYYYQETKDVATNFFISKLTKGNYVFEYKLRVVQSGSYATGTTSLQSMYAPEFNAHSQGQRLIFSSSER